MHVAGELTPWLEAAFGLILAVLAVVTAELLARYAETDARKGTQTRLPSVSDTRVFARP